MMFFIIVSRCLPRLAAASPEEGSSAITHINLQPAMTCPGLLSLSRPCAVLAAEWISASRGSRSRSGILWAAPQLAPLCIRGSVEADGAGIPTVNAKAAS
jgi:hypothetical protein